MSKRRLGKGLDALLSVTRLEEIDAEDNAQDIVIEDYINLGKIGESIYKIVSSIFG